MVADAVFPSRSRLPRGRAADAALAGGVFLLTAVGSLESVIAARREPWSVTILGWVMIAVCCGALYYCRRHPLAVTTLVLVATAVYYVTSTYDGPMMVAFIVALYTLAAEGRVSAATALVAVTVLAVGVGTLAGNDDVDGIALFMLTGWLVGTVALGWVRHSRVAYAREVEQRAATEERLRIARELHDVIGHHISLINVQSGAALRRLEKNPAKGAAGAGEALGAIKDASREALRELRATLGVLRQVEEAAPTTPTASLERVGELIDSARRTGLDARLHSSGRRDSPPTEVDLAAYRIIQEALTNVTRHAHASAVTVQLDRGPDRTTVEITDNGRGTPVGGGTPGNGLRGMSERARALGGELTAGPGAGGGFTVRASLPHSNGASSTS